MLIRDYDEKMAMVLDFYDQAVEVLSMVHDGISGFHYLYNFDIRYDQVTDFDKKQHTYDFEAKINKRKKQLLIELGRVGEYAVKYILLLKQINDYPNQTFEEFKSKAMFSLADKGVANTYVNQYHMDSTIVDAVKLAKEQHKLQPLHDYDYLFTMLKILHPNIVKDIHKIIDLKIKRYSILDSNLPDNWKRLYSHFPDRIILGITDLPESELQQYRDDFENIIRVSGDTFTRLRYLENNMDNKQYDLNAILDMLDYLISYIQLVHEINHDDLNLDIVTAYRKDSLINYSIDSISRSAPKKDYYDYCQSKLIEEKKRINDIFSIKRIANNSDLQESVFFRSSLSVEDIRKLANMDYNDDGLYALICNNITEEYINYFRMNNISSVYEIIRIVSNNSLSLDEFKELGFDKDQLRLLIWLDIDTIKVVSENKKVYEYIINSNILNLFFRSYKPTSDDYELFRRIIELDEIKNNPILLNLMDCTQFRLLNQLNIDKPSNDEVILNIKENINELKNKKVFKRIPIMLSYSNNKNVYQLIYDNGFNDNMIDNLDSTIFCIPFEIVSIIINVMKENNINFIENGNINTVFYRILEKMRNENKIEKEEKVLVPLQHLIINNSIENEQSDLNIIKL